MPDPDDRTANQCYQQAAELSGDLGEYQRAMELYQIVADWSLTSALTKYSVKEYWLRAALCSIAMGVRPLSNIIVKITTDISGLSHDESITPNVRSKGRYIPIDPRGQIRSRTNASVRRGRCGTIYCPSVSI